MAASIEAHDAQSLPAIPAWHTAAQKNGKVMPRSNEDLRREYAVPPFLYRVVTPDFENPRWRTPSYPKP